MSGMTVTGRVLKVEHRAGNFANDKGENIAYDFHVAHVLVDDTDVIEVKFRGDRPDARPPAKGAEIAVTCELPKGVKPLAVGYVTAAEGSRVKAV